MCFLLCEWRPLGELDEQEEVSGKDKEEEEDELCIYIAFSRECDLLRSLSRGCVPSAVFHRCFEGGFARASELSEPESFL